MTTLLELDRVAARYGPVQALTDVSLVVREGEVVAVLGANGAGKTTTLRAISGTVSHTGGIELEGKQLKGGPEVAARAGVPLEERDAFLEDVEPGLSESLLSSPIGEVVGPLPVANGFALLRVNGKVAPTLADPVIQERLREEVPRRALEREVRNRVQWHEHF